MKLDEAVAALAALAHPTRLDVFRLLVAEGPNGMRAGDIALHFGVAPPTLSFHLKELDRAGLVRSMRRQRYVHYAIDVEGMRALLTYLTEDCCKGRPEICADLDVAAVVCEKAAS